MNSVKEINVKNCPYYFFDDKTIIKNIDPNKMKLDEKPYKNYILLIRTYHISYEATKSVKP